MRIKNAALIAVVSLSFATSVVFAQESAESQDPASERSEVVTQVSPRSPEPVAEKKEKLRERVTQKRMDALTTAQAKREQFKEKLQTIRDTQKVVVVQRLDNQFIKINNTSTDRWTTALEQMSGMVERASSQAANLEESGVNTAALDLAITRAQTAITTAQTAVSNQAGKSYVLTITTETALRANVGATVSQLRQDLRTTHNSVVAAKRAVMQVVKALAVATNEPGRLSLPQAADSAETAE